MMRRLRKEGDRMVDGKLCDKDGKPYSVVALNSDGVPEYGYHSVKEMIEADAGSNLVLERLWGYVYRMAYSMNMMWHSLRYAIQRMVYGFDERECWNIDTSLMKFITTRVSLMNKNRHGAPNDYCDNARSKLKEDGYEFTEDDVVERASDDFGNDLDELVLNAKLYLYYVGMCVEDRDDGTLGFENRYPCPLKTSENGEEMTDYARVEELRIEAKNKVFDYLRNHLESLWD